MNPFTGNFKVFATSFAVLASVFLASTTGCFNASSVPKDFESVDRVPKIYPDYVETTLPPNIAPTNFMIEEEGSDFVVRISGADGASICVSGRKAIIPEKKWRGLLEANRGGTITVDVFAKRDGKWRKFKAFENGVSEDPIDSYLAYRLIEPGYDYGHRIMLAQRRLENFDEEIFFDNRSVASSPCVNCHSFQNHRTDRFLFHFRRTDDPVRGGTIVVDGKKAVKTGGRVDEDGINLTYPSWRSTGDLVAFSANYTRQYFHSLSTQKIEVFDAFSDLVLFDAARNELSIVARTNDEFETFPFWSPDGDALYYCSAHLEPTTPQNPPEGRVAEVVKRATELRYNIYRRSFDESTRVFGEPEVVVDAASRGRTALFPRTSPDGKFLAYTLAESGTFSIWRPEADLWLLNLETGENRVWREVNSDDADSYHSWSSTGRWIVISSRREDGQYTRLYLARVAEDGTATKPFVLPQKDPEHNRKRFKSYNVPELNIEPIRIDYRKLVDAAKKEPVATNNRAF